MSECLPCDHVLWWFEDQMQVTDWLNPQSSAKFEYNSSNIPYFFAWPCSNVHKSKLFTLTHGQAPQNFIHGHVRMVYYNYSAQIRNHIFLWLIIENHKTQIWLKCIAGTHEWDLIYLFMVRCKENQFICCFCHATYTSKSVYKLQVDPLSTFHETTG